MWDHLSGLPHVTFHGLRHTHISTLLREGIPITTVSKRAGHENPAITLSIYAHVMGGMDEEAAFKVDEIMNTLLNSK
jgi:integrase